MSARAARLRPRRVGRGRGRDPPTVTLRISSGRGLLQATPTISATIFSSDIDLENHFVILEYLKAAKPTPAAAP